MARIRALVACALVATSSVVVSVTLSSSAGATVPGGDITVCPHTTNGTTVTLTADCDTTAPLTVPDGFTVDGAGHTITAHDPGPGVPFDGGVLTNDPTGHSMNIEALTIKGTSFAEDGCAAPILNGIFFNDAGGSVSNVVVQDITIHTGCGTGIGIRANATAGVARTVTITNARVSGYSAGGLIASGMMTMNVSASTVGPPETLFPAIIAQNGVQYGGTGVNAGAGGTITDSTIYGSGFGDSSDVGTAVLLFGASGVTLSSDTITGAGTDVGVDVEANSIGALITRNQIGRTTPDSPDSFGIGVSVDAGSSAIVTCNTFSGWVTDVSGVAPQPVCITTTTVPSGTQHVPYSATLAAVGGTAPYTWSLASGSLPPGLSISSSGTITGTPTTAGTFTFTIKATDSVAATATQSFSLTVAVGSQGYWLGAADGGVFNFGVAGFFGSTGSLRLNAPVVGIANTPAGGYWLVASDGGVFSFGAPFFGSMGGRPLLAPIVGMAATPDGGGYYLVGADGSVFPFGDAVFHGSMQGTALNKPVVGIGVTPDNGGYYLAASDGGVFTFGDAVFHGSMGGTKLNKPVVGMAVDNVTSGYWLVAADGGVFSLGAPYLGSMGGKPLNAPVVGMAATVDDNGYRFAATDGGVFCFGIAEFHGSMGGIRLNRPVVGMSSIGP
jgi:Putative Ig domain